MRAVYALTQLGHTEHVLEHHLDVGELGVGAAAPNLLRAREGAHQRAAIRDKEPASGAATVSLRSDLMRRRALNFMV